MKAVLHCSTRSALPQVAFFYTCAVHQFWKFRTFTADFSVGTLVVVLRFLSSYVGRLTSDQVFQSRIVTNQMFRWASLKCFVHRLARLRRSDRCDVFVHANASDLVVFVRDLHKLHACPYSQVLHQSVKITPGQSVSIVHGLHGDVKCKPRMLPNVFNFSGHQSRRMKVCANLAI